MDKAAIMFSTLTHNYTIMVWFWVLITLPVGGWHIWYFPAKKQLTAQQLTEISFKFRHINSDYFWFSVFGISVFILLPAILTLGYVDDWSLTNFGIRFYPGVVTAVSIGYAIYQALFALLKGVYPMGKSLSYAYDEKVVNRRVAKYQIMIALGTFLIVNLFFFITVR